MTSFKGRLQKGVVFLGLSAGLLCGCGSGSTAYQNQIFYPATFFDASAQNLTGGQPDLSWPAVHEKHVVAAIFNAAIQVRDNYIQNKSAIVWIWDSGLPTGRDGNVSFADGLSNADTGAPPVALASGTYHWAVWAFDEKGVPSYSTVEMTMVIP